MSTEEKAIFAAGCFWGIEAKFQELKGVVGTRVGYTGGHTSNPDYKMVCYTDSGHAEAVEVTFNPASTSFDDLLTAFWGMHDPTQIDRQGVDVGSQYRSAIFFIDENQKMQALASKQKRESNYTVDIATQIVPAETFWQAEDYHQCYVQKRRKQGFF